ncbi:MAG: aquaporin [Saccharofermentans sp.]|jgi:aquaporin Z|nr:aquaporin [Clostridiales bacterium]MCR5048857.1 aquaporin [Saccharofermentans sp.]
MDSFKKYLAEFIGTFVLVFAACGTAAAVGCKGSEANGAYILTALAFGLVIVAMAYSIGNISGCHINPAVSIGVLIAGKMSAKDFCGYVISQFLGGIVGAACIGVLLGFDCGFGANGLYNDNIMLSLFVEVLLTFIFVLAILGVTSKPEFSNVAGIVIGLTLTLVHIFGIHFTGTSVNPARSFASAIFAGGAALSNVWVFIVAPLVGGALAALVWKFLSEGKK